MFRCRSGGCITLSKTITYLDIRRKVKCKPCNGKGEVFSNSDDHAITDDQLFLYVCKKCDGKGYEMKHRTVSLEQFRELKN